ncbi:trypsin-like serine peptidase [Microvirga sesbaniae]|uniref:trypsin-like serine peptidase n=1 Tax=Microvirga sesbaniae TaxID=681392 RepID=UPI0021C74690|nr:trypsin-like serine protease [Microvirga sp. HBU67692]
MFKLTASRARMLCLMVCFLVIGNPAFAIVNGTDLSKDPLGSAQRFLVTVRGYVNNHTTTHKLCLGAAIAKDVIITAGHCLRDVKGVEVEFITSLSPLAGEVIAAKSWRVHPLMNAVLGDVARVETDRYHDIAVILLASRSKYAVPVTAAPRDFVPDSFAKNAPTFYNFGHIRDSLYVQQPGYQFATLDLVIRHQNAPHWYRVSLPKGVLICEGDSGSPITISAADEKVEGKNNHYLVGIQVTGALSGWMPNDLQAAIAHWGSPSEIPKCARATTFVDIAGHADWIDEKLAEMDPARPRRVRFKGDKDQPEEASASETVTSGARTSDLKQKSCVVHDAEDTGVSVRNSPNGKIATRLKNGRAVAITSTANDAKGRPWHLVQGQHEGRAQKLGYVFGELVVCR